MQKPKSPALIIVGGFAGTGKTAISRRLSAELGIPRLGSDTLGRTINTSLGSHSVTEPKNVSSGCALY